MDTVKLRMSSRAPDRVILNIHCRHSVHYPIPSWKTKDYVIAYYKYTWRGKLYLDVDIGPGYLYSNNLYDLAW